MKRKFYFLMAVISGLVFALGLYYYMKNMKADIPVEVKPLVVAGEDIPARSIIQKDQLQIKKIPAVGYPQGAASSIDDVAGKVLLVNLKQGDVILSPMLEASFKDQGEAVIETGNNGFSLTVPEGKRAVAVPVSLVSGVGYKVKPGDRVDVLVTLDIRDEAGNTKTVTSLAAQDVLVLNTGDNLSREKNKLNSNGSYILALSVTQAMAVTLGSEKGTIRLLLRNPANKEIYNEPPIDSRVYLDRNYFNRFK